MTQQIKVTRNSVCAGDDMDAPHLQRVSMTNLECWGDFVLELTSKYKLPRIHGGDATWELQIDNESICIVAQQWELPKFHSTTPSKKPSQTQEAHFNYHAQIDPNKLVK